MTIRRGYNLCMPVLVVNLGVEMIYVLEQRLRAQKIPEDKARQGEAQLLLPLHTTHYTRPL